MVTVVLWLRAVRLLILVYAVDVLQAVVNTIGMIAYPGESVYKMYFHVLNPVFSLICIVFPRTLSLMYISFGRSSNTLVCFFFALPETHYH